MAARHWQLDPAVTFLNHGSFGACPTPILEAQRRWRDRLEAEPVRFLVRELDGALADVRRELGRFVGADPDDLAFVPNATARREHRPALAAVRARRRAPGHRPRVQRQPQRPPRRRRTRRRPDGPGPRSRSRSAGPADVLEAILAAVTPRTRLVLVSHVTSPTALVFPVAELVARARPARHRHARRRCSRPRNAAARPRSARARPTTPATATSGSAPPRALPSSTYGATARRGSTPSRSPTGRTTRGPTALASGWSSTGPARPTRRRSWRWARRSRSWEAC